MADIRVQGKFLSLEYLSLTVNPCASHTRIKKSRTSLCLYGVLK